MREKYPEDYIDELAIYFPQIEKKELLRMMTSSSSLLTKYAKNWYRGFTLSTVDTLAGKKLARFTVARIYGKKHLNGMKKRAKIMSKKFKDGKK